MKRSLSYEQSLDRRLDNLTLEFIRLRGLFAGAPDLESLLSGLSKELAKVDAGVKAYFLRQGELAKGAKFDESSRWRSMVRGDRVADKQTLDLEGVTQP